MSASYRAPTWGPVLAPQVVPPDHLADSASRLREYDPRVVFHRALFALLCHFFLETVIIR